MSARGAVIHAGVEATGLTEARVTMGGAHETVVCTVAAEVARGVAVEAVYSPARMQILECGRHVWDEVCLHAQMHTGFNVVHVMACEAGFVLRCT
jgi:hypothetical protein